MLRRLSVLDPWLPAWILAAMAVGLLLGRVITGLAATLDAVKVGSVSLPIAVGWFHLQVLPGWLGLPTTTDGFSVGAITVSVLVFPGVPLVAGFLTRTLGKKARGRDW